MATLNQQNRNICLRVLPSQRNLSSQSVDILKLMLRLSYRLSYLLFYTTFILMSLDKAAWKFKRTLSQNEPHFRTTTR